MKTLTAHEKFLKELRAPIRRYESSLLKKRSTKKTRSRLTPAEEVELAHDLERKFDELFEATGSEEED